MKRILTIPFFFYILFIVISLPLMAQEKKFSKIILNKQQVKEAIKLLPYFLKNIYTNKKDTKINLNIELLNKLATDNGFNNYQEFLKSSSTIMMAYAYLKLKSDEAMLLDQLKKVKPEIAKAFKPQMHSFKKTLQAYEEKLSPLTVKAVIPYITKIKQILKSNR